jgi:hypothetical protein
MYENRIMKPLKLLSKGDTRKSKRGGEFDQSIYMHYGNIAKKLLCTIDVL